MEGSTESGTTEVPGAGGTSPGATSSGAGGSLASAGMASFGAGGASGAGDAMHFDKWSGDVQHLTDPKSASTNVTMPRRNVSISANYAN